MSTWEQRMAKRAQLAAHKRRIRNNLEGATTRTESTTTGTSVLLCEGFEPITVEHWLFYPSEDEWPEIVG